MSIARPDQARNKTVAVQAEVLYLVNLMLAPGLAFLLLALLWVAHRHDADALARQHLSQTLGVSLIGGGLILIATLVFAATGGLASGYLVMTLVLYFTFIHSSLILFGVIGLVKAMAGEAYTYPLVGPMIGRLFNR
ncbi:MAG TPA: hypothetical protein ENJ79_11510 [Gammaproteobacteria bacterium]|nr:hypothetical protein [Gammaproteobacteria bacterium]